MAFGDIKIPLAAEYESASVFAGNRGAYTAIPLSSLYHICQEINHKFVGKTICYKVFEDERRIYVERLSIKAEADAGADEGYLVVLASSCGLISQAR